MIRGTEEEIKTLADYLGVTGLECPKNTEEFSKAYTRLFIHRDGNGKSETQFRFFIDRRKKSGTIKIRHRMIGGTASMVCCFMVLATLIPLPY